MAYSAFIDDYNLSKGNCIWAMLWENQVLLHAKKKGTDQPTHQLDLFKDLLLCILSSLCS